MGVILLWVPDRSITIPGIVTGDDFDSDSDVTNHPVETGSDITDNVRMTPDELLLECFISNEPIGVYADLGTLALPKLLPHPDAIFQGTKLDPPVYHAPPNIAGLPIPNPGVLTRTVTEGLRSLSRGENPFQSSTINFMSYQFLQPKDYVTGLLKTLRELQEAVVLFEVVTPKWHYVDMILQKVAMSRGAQDGTGARFTLKFKQIRTVDVDVVAAPEPTELRSVPAVNKGSGHATLKTIEITGPDKTALLSLSGILGGAIDRFLEGP